jgi:hypothetical protein
MDRLLSFYAPDFNAYGKTRDQWARNLKAKMFKVQGHSIEIKDKSFLRWTDSTDTMVITFGEVVTGNRTGWTKRQYWNRQGGQWKTFLKEYSNEYDTHQPPPSDRTDNRFADQHFSFCRIGTTGEVSD